MQSNQWQKKHKLFIDERVAMMNYQESVRRHLAVIEIRFLVKIFRRPETRLSS